MLALGGALAGSSGALGARPSHGTRCLTTTVRRRLVRISGLARYRYEQERGGAAVHQARSRIERNTALAGDLAAGDVAAAQLLADGLLVRHVVRIRITLDGRALVDANPGSFAVAGAIGQLRGPRGRRLGRLGRLGRLDVTIQDVAGYIKLVHKFSGGQVVVRGSSGRLLATQPRLVAAATPALGCVRVAGGTYAVRTFPEPGFAGERLSVEVLTPA